MFGQDGFATAQELASRFVAPELDLHGVNAEGLSAGLEGVKAKRVTEPPEVELDYLMVPHALAENQHESRLPDTFGQTDHSHNLRVELHGVLSLLVAHHDLTSGG